jgi:FkbM family methyltransferase
MKTAQKIRLAKIAYKTLSTARRLLGQDDHCTVTRSGIRYELDLSQGIDLAIYLQGTFEPSTRGALERNILPGSNVIDIGANVGAHTLTMARLVGDSGHVLAFEPTDFAYRKLQRNLELNTQLKRRISSYQCFLGPVDAASIPPSIYSSWPLTSSGDLHWKHLSLATPTSQAISRSLDSVWTEHHCPPIQLVKMDVDGFECEVLAGARKMMQRDHPLFIMELAPYILEEYGTSLKELLSFFLPLGYRFFDETTGQPLPDDVQRLTDRIGDGASINVIARVVSTPSGVYAQCQTPSAREKTR